MIKPWLAIPAILVVVLAVGCAKRPAMTQASAPAPSAVVVSPRAAAESAPRRAAAPSGAAPVRPAPREFVATPELRDIHFDFDKYDIRPDGGKTLDANAAWLKSMPGGIRLG